MFNASLIILVHHVINHGKRHLLLSTKVPINVSIGDVSFTTITTETLLGILIDSELSHDTAQKFSIKDFFSKCDQIRSFLQVWSNLLKKFLMENFIFCAELAVTKSMVGLS